MVFKRRNKPPVLHRIRDALYPRKGWSRPFEYVGHRIKRLPDTPHKIALGFSCGVFVSFSPFFGLHFFLAAICAVMVRANVLASLLGTFFGNPLTFPFIATISLSFGRRLFGLRSSGHDFVRVKDAFSDAFAGLWQSTKSIFGFGPSAWDRLADFWSSVFLPYLVGGLAPGLICAIAAYTLSRPLIAAYQARRKSKLLARARERMLARQAKADAAE